VGILADHITDRKIRTPPLTLESGRAISSQDHETPLLWGK